MTRKQFSTKKWRVGTPVWVLTFKRLRVNYSMFSINAYRIVETKVHALLTATDENGSRIYGLDVERPELELGESLIASVFPVHSNNLDYLFASKAQAERFLQKRQKEDRAPLRAKCILSQFKYDFEHAEKDLAQLRSLAKSQ